MLLVYLPSARDLGILYRALGLPPVGSLSNPPGVGQFQTHGNHAFLIGSDKERLDGVKNFLKPTKVLILNPMYDYVCEEDEYLILTVASFEEHWDEELSQRVRDQLAVNFFKESVWMEDVMLGLNLIMIPNRPREMGLNFVRIFGPQPQAQPQPSKRKRIRTDDTCIICTERPVNTVFNCGHECSCEECADRAMQEKAQCPLCREIVTNLIVSSGSEKNE